ncbi:tetratricopeptide repeat-containing sensor histidine kinase [Flavobacterium sp. W22_SRS_FP1]|uniref:tetratricopeptide repeat-containing sensor histidine kinase n=1 Tax=Flavobacterium sp. W22_SRS_FP1 TaxID=3240276 RepID=UPI003F8F920D
MIQNRFVLLFFLSPFLFGNVLYSQNRVPSQKEITELTTEATNLMKEGKFEKSLVKSRIALKYAIIAKNDNAIATCYNIIAANFDELTEPDKAFFYYQKGLIIANRTTNNQLKNWLNNNLGNIYCFDRKQYTKGISHYKKSLEYSTKNRDSAEIVFTKLNITWAYFDIGRFNDGLPYLKFINKYHDKFGNESSNGVLNMLNGMYSSYNDEPQKAKSYFQKAIQLGIEQDFKSDLAFAYLEYSKFLLKNDDHKKAYKNLALYNSTNAKVIDEDKRKKVNVAGINLELDEYKREIDIIETKYKTKQQILLEQQSKNKQISLIIISLLILIIILFYFLFQNTRLKQKNKLKDIQSKIQEKIINASVNGQEMERKKIANFLHDNISALLSAAGLHLSVFSSKNQLEVEEIVKTKLILREAHDKVRDLSHELLPSLLTRFGLFYALNDLCEKNSNSRINFEYSSTMITTVRYNDDYEIKIYSIIMELLNNIIKHSEATNAFIGIEEKNKSLFIHVRDNGKGFDSADYYTIEGFGLNQIKARVNNIGGEITILSKIKSGTSIQIKAPITYQ